MNDQTHEDRKAAVLKTLAIIGFVAAVIITAWLAVQAVRLLPAAFSTLATLIESRENATEDLEVIGTESIVNAGQTLTVSWTPLTQSGTYTFSYECAEGVSATITGARGEMSAVGCDTEIALPEGEHRMAITFASEKRRFTDVKYAIGFIPEGSDTLLHERANTITVVNPTISARGVATEETPETVPEVEETPAAEPEVRPATTPGYADLAVSLVSLTVYDAHTHTAVPAYSAKRGDRVAAQFSVTNLGGQTSGIWYFDATLPSADTTTFLSPAQDPLAPQAGRLFTLEFTAGGTAGALGIEVAGGNDGNAANNTFIRTLSVY